MVSNDDGGEDDDEEDGDCTHVQAFAHAIRTYECRARNYAHARAYTHAAQTY